MHQLPRPAPRSAASANSQQTNPTRTNNPREELGSRPSSGQGTASELGRASPGTMSEAARPEESSTGQNPEAARLNLIIQHFFSKAALIIISSRVTLPPAYNKDGDVRLDKWFNTWVEDTSALSQHLQPWKTMDVAQQRPAPLTIEVYLEMAQLTQNQSLVAVDEQGKRWDVNDAFRKRAASASSSPVQLQEIVYERWTLSLDDSSNVPASQLNDAPPNVYKKGVVLLRSLFTYTKFLPAWKFARRLSRQTGNGPVPKPKFRIVDSLVVDSQPDTLTQQFFPSNSAVTENYHFAPLPCTFGSLKISVAYRSSCNFEIDTAERLLSARFVGGPSESGSETAARPADSLSVESQRTSSYRPWDRIQTSSDNRAEEMAVRLPPDHRTASGSKSSLRSEGLPASLPRRTSVSFQPFKAGSLSSSPGSGLQVPSSPSSSLGRNTTPSFTPSSRSRSSLNTLPQQALRTPTMVGEAFSGSSSPKPAPIQRYSSSFGNRRARFPSNAGSKTEEDNNSSGRASISSANRGSVVLNEGGSDVSTPPQDDAQSIGDFLKMLDTNSRGLTSFNKTDQASVSANSQRTAAQYSKFTRMRDSNTHLSDSMSSSVMLQRSSSSSSRQLSNIPGLIGGASLSGSSSPGKPISPHTPHMPAVPSRLSNNSIINYSSRDDSRNRTRTESPITDSGDGSSDATTRRDRGTNAIDIPTSPRTFPASRRSSSVHHQSRLQGQVDDDVLPFGLRSSSLPNEERPTYAIEDEEPLLFAMGELGSQRRLE